MTILTNLLFRKQDDCSIVYRKWFKRCMRTAANSHRIKVKALDFKQETLLLKPGGRSFNINIGLLNSLSMASGADKTLKHCTRCVWLCAVYGDRLSRITQLHLKRGGQTIH
jgi:hypothetical protein